MTRRDCLLAVWAVGMASLLTFPWSQFQGHAHWDKVAWIPFVSSGINVRDIVLNIAAFVPLGWLLAPGHARRWSLGLAGVLIAAAVFSAGGELYQVFSHSRHPSATDIAANTFGAYAGFALCTARERRRVRPVTAG